MIGFYGVLTGGRFGVEGPLDRTGDIRAPLLGLFGGDQAIPVEEVEQFDARLAEAGLDHEIHAYPGAPHSFFDRRFEGHRKRARTPGAGCSASSSGTPPESPR